MNDFGVLVSHHQGIVQFDNLALAGARFINHKATEGISYKDPTYLTNSKLIRAAGLGLIAFHYMYAGEPMQQVNHYLDYAERCKPDLYEIDWEVDFRDKERMVNNVYDMLDLVQAATHFIPILYTNPDFLIRYKKYGTSKLARFHLHLAAYKYGTPPQTFPFVAWDLWQKTNKGSVLGISGEACIEECNGRFSELVARCNNG